MQRSVLKRGQRLWAEDDPASTIAVIETGKVGAWSGKRLLGIAFPKMVLGESALLPTTGAPPVRTASVIAIEDDTTVTEYPPALVQQSFGTGVPRLVMRML